MSYDIEYVASVITTAEAMQERMDVEDYINFFSPTQQDMIVDILVDLDLIVRRSWQRDIFDPKFEEERFVEYWAWTALISA